MDQDPPTGAQRVAPRVAPPMPLLGPRLPRSVQLVLLGGALIVVLIAFVGGPAVLHLLGRSEPAPAAAEAPPQAETAAFKPTDRQWATLKIETVRDRVFQPVAETDGRIALDDELVTPVFSPYSGRVSRLMAAPATR